jgi:hypothetical protein
MELRLGQVWCVTVYVGKAAPSSGIARGPVTVPFLGKGGGKSTSLGQQSTAIPSSQVPNDIPFVPSPRPASAMPRKNDKSACSAEPLGPEPIVSKGLQLQFTFRAGTELYVLAGAVECSEQYHWFFHQLWL